MIFLALPPALLLTWLSVLSTSVRVMLRRGKDQSIFSPFLCKKLFSAVGVRVWERLSGEKESYDALRSRKDVEILACTISQRREGWQPSNEPKPHPLQSPFTSYEPLVPIPCSFSAYRTP